MMHKIEMILGSLLVMITSASASSDTQLICDIDDASGGQCQNCDSISIKTDLDKIDPIVLYRGANGKSTLLDLSHFKTRPGYMSFSSGTRKGLRVRFKAYRHDQIGVGLDARYKDSNTEETLMSCVGVFQNEPVDGQN